MSFLDSLFGGGGSKSVQTTDAFKALPKEFQDLLLAQARTAQSNVEGVGEAREAYMDPDRAIAPLNAVEQAGLNRVVDDSDAIGGLENAGVGAINGMSGDIRGMAGLDVDAFVPGYENPYLDDVVGTTLERMDTDLARRNLMDESAAAAIGGTTNTRRAVAQGIDRSLTEREKAAAEATMRADAFDRSRNFALDRGDFELDRGDRTAATRLAQGQGLGDAAARRSARGITEGSYLQTYGEKLRGLDQARLDAPRDALGWEASILGNVDAPRSQSSTVTNSGGNTWGQMAGGALAAYQILSDERAKEDIAPLSGREALEAVREMRPATYSYREGLGHVDGVTTGLMAQDLSGIPGAVAEGDDGYLRVDPYPVLATLAAAVQALDEKVNA